MDKVKLSEIQIKYSPRVEFGGIKQLAENIKEVGLLQPLTITKNGSGFVLVDGERRYKALQMLKWAEVPVYIVEASEEIKKEIPIATDYFKSKLSVGEKAIGVSYIINKEKKDSVKTFAKRYDMNIKQVNNLLKLATLHPSVLAQVGISINIPEGLELTKVKREDIQIKCAKWISEHEGYTLVEALGEIAFPVFFDNVFTLEQLKSDKQLGIILVDEYEDEVVFCFDKEYAEQKKAEMNEREGAKYKKSEDKAKGKKEAKGEAKEHEDVVKAKAKVERKKCKKSFDSTLPLYKDSIVAHLKKKASAEDIQGMAKNFINRMGGDNAKLLCRAFGLEFKVSECDSYTFKGMIEKVLIDYVKTADDLVQVIILVEKLLPKLEKVSMFENNKEWVKFINQLNK